MPLRQAQAKDKAAVLAEIQREHRGPGVGHDWRADNFTFKAPSDAWLGSLKPLAALTVELRGKAHGFDVLLVGESKAGKVYTNVGTIRDSR